MRTRLLGAAVVAVVGLMGFTANASAYPVSTSFALNYVANIGNMGSPPGVNRTDCKLTTSKPRPIILQHGTGESRAANWGGLGPFLANAGFCVFAPNNGFYNGLPGLDFVEKSAAQLSDYVDYVQSLYPGKKVDIVGHSQGGMMPRYYIKNLGGAAKVSKLIGIAPSNHGTTLSGIANLAGLLGVTGIVTAVAPAGAQQIKGSPFITALNSGDETPGAVKYYVAATNGDQVVTPWQSAFLSGATQNWTAQSGCILEASEHLQISFSLRVMTKVANWLDGRTRSLPCNLVLPYI